MSQIIYSNIRLARLFNGFSLTDLGERLDKSKQYLSRVETGAEPVSASLEQALVEHLGILPEFLRHVDPMPLTEEQCHFRKQLTTKVALRQYARARGEMLKRLVCVLEEHLDMPGTASPRRIRPPKNRSSVAPSSAEVPGPRLGPDQQHHACG